MPINMNQEFSNTDAELARCIKSRIKHELNAITGNKDKQTVVLPAIKTYLLELVTEIINEED